MDPILFLSLVIIMAAALPWWPYSAYGRLRHHRPWDWLLDSPSREDKLLFLHLAHQTKTSAFSSAERWARPSFWGSTAKSGDEAMRWRHGSSCKNAKGV